MASHFGALTSGGPSIDPSTSWEGPTFNLFSYIESQVGSEYNAADNQLTSADGGDYLVSVTLPCSTSGALAGTSNIRLSVLQFYASDSSTWEMASSRDSQARDIGEAFGLAVVCQLRLAAGDKFTYRLDNLSTDLAVNVENSGAFSGVKLAS